MGPCRQTVMHVRPLPCTQGANSDGPRLFSVIFVGRRRFDSMTAPVSLLTFLCSALAARLGETAIERLRVIDAIHEEWGEVVAAEL